MPDTTTRTPTDPGTASAHEREAPYKGPYATDEPYGTQGAHEKKHEHEDEDEDEDERSTLGLIASLARDASLLVRQEAELVKAELSEKLDQTRSGVTEAASGALIAYAGLLVLLLAAVAGLAEVLPTWAAALIVGTVVGTVGLVLLGSAKKNLSAKNLTPERSARSLQRDADLVRDQARKMRS